MPIPAPRRPRLGTCSLALLALLLAVSGPRAASAQAAAAPAADAGGAAPLETVILTHQQLAVVAKAMADDLGPHVTGKHILLFNDRDLQGLLLHRAVSAEVAVLTAAFKALPAPGGVGTEALPIAPSDIKTLIEAVQLLKTDVTVEHSTVNVEETALIAELARQLPHDAGKQKLIYSQLSVPGLFAKPAPSGLMRELAGLVDLWGKKNKEYDEAKAGKDPRLVALNARFDALMSGLRSVNEKSAVTPMIELERADLLMSAVRVEGEEPAPVRLVFVRVHRAGGSARKTTNFWRLFSGPKFSYSGGLVASYVVFEEHGVFLSSNTFYSHSGFEDFPSKSSKATTQKLK